MHMHVNGELWACMSHAIATRLHVVGMYHKFFRDFLLRWRWTIGIAMHTRCETSYPCSRK